MEYTKGEWKAEQGRIHFNISIGHLYYDNPIAKVYYSEANAQLIASAPDLYEACKEAYNLLPTTAKPSDFLVGHGNWGLNEAEYNVAKIIAKALAKAEGKEGGGR